MEKESSGRRTAATIRNREYPAEHFLCHPKGLGVGHEEEDESGIEGIFGLEGNIDRGLLGRLLLVLTHFFS